MPRIYTPTSTHTQPRARYDNRWQLIGFKTPAVSNEVPFVCVYVCVFVLRHIQVFLRVRNLSDSARDLVVMFTEDPGDGRQRRGGNSGGGRRRLSLERSTVRGMRSKSDSGGGGGGGADGFGSDTDSDDAEPGVARDISPSVSVATPS